MQEAQQEQHLLHFMVLDAEVTKPSDSSGPVVSIYALTPSGSSVCLRVPDFRNFFYFPCPEKPENPSDAQLQAFLKHVNKSLQKAGEMVEDIEIVQKIPILYYRPGVTTLPFMKVTNTTSAAQNKVSKAVMETANASIGGLLWAHPDPGSLEDNVNFMTRFMVEMNLSGGAWGAAQRSRLEQVAEDAKQSSCSEEYIVSFRDLQGFAPNILQDVAPSEQSAWSTHPPARMKILSFGTQCGVPSQRTKADPQKDAITAIANHLLSFGSAKDERPPLRPVVFTWPKRQLRRDGPAVAEPAAATSTASGGGAAGGKKKATKGRQKQKATTTSTGSSSSSSSGGGGGGGGDDEPLTEVVITGQGAVEVRMFDTEQQVLEAWEHFVRVTYDPDVLAGFDIGGHDVTYLCARMAALGLQSVILGRYALGPSTRSRPKDQLVKVKKVVNYGKNWVKSQSRMTAISNQETFQILNSTGRLILDVLRAVLTQQKMSHFTFDECVSVLLGKQRERLNQYQLTQLWSGQPAFLPDDAAEDNGQPVRGPSRLPDVQTSYDAEAKANFVHFVAHAVQDCMYASELLFRLRTLTESIELAKVTGLTLDDAIYRAQMARTWSLLLRVARTENYAVGAPSDPREMAPDTTPYLYHPIDNATAGYYRAPIAILDFASLYPSIFIAYNMCYSTLLHPSDAAAIPEEDCNLSPASEYLPSDRFVKPHIRRGLFPRILQGLLYHRNEAKKQLKQTTDKHLQSVLDARQQALKVCANAAYGFTGSTASPLRCCALAESCLRYGNFLCRTAKGLIETAFQEEGARMIYGQTDSLMILFEAASSSVDATLELGQRAGQFVTNNLPEALTLKFERVLCPFLLDITNYYAGVSYEAPIHSPHMPPMPYTTDNGKLVDPRGPLLIRGFASERRGEPGIARRVVREAFELILRDDNVDGALEFVKAAVRRLMSGDVSMAELAVTKALWRVDMGDIQEMVASEKESGAVAHVALAERLLRRDPTRVFMLGERIPHVFLLGEAGARQSELAEDPVYALKHNLPLDYKLYWEHKLKPHIERMFRYVTTSAQLRELLNGDHTRLRASVKTARKGSLFGFVSSSQAASCLACRRPIKSPTKESPLCENCMKEGRITEAYIKAITRKEHLEARWCEVMAQCSRINTNGMSARVENRNFEADMFQLKNMLEEANAVVERFDSFDPKAPGGMKPRNEAQPSEPAKKAAKSSLSASASSSSTSSSIGLSTPTKAAPPAAAELECVEIDSPSVAPSEVHCPQCTYLNPASATKCEVCSGPLLKASPEPKRSNKRPAAAVAGSPSGTPSRKGGATAAAGRQSVLTGFFTASPKKAKK